MEQSTEENASLQITLEPESKQCESRIIGFYEGLHAESFLRQICYRYNLLLMRPLTSQARHE